VNRKSLGGITMFLVAVIRSGSQPCVSLVSGSLPPTPMAGVSIRRACGNSWRRTRDRAPSAPTSRSPVAELPSAKYAVTVPSPACS
jgi:hypothetical protein